MKKNPTLAKTLSWLVVSGILITLTGWYESGTFWVGLMTAFWATIIKTPVYSLHEALWGRVIFKEDKPKPTVTPKPLPVLCVFCDSPDGVFQPEPCLFCQIPKETAA